MVNASASLVVMSTTDNLKYSIINKAWEGSATLQIKMMASIGAIGLETRKIEDTVYEGTAPH